MQIKVHALSNRLFYTKSVANHGVMRRITPCFLLGFRLAIRAYLGVPIQSQHLLTALAEAPVEGTGFPRWKCAHLCLSVAAGTSISGCFEQNHLPLNQLPRDGSTKFYTT